MGSGEPFPGADALDTYHRFLALYADGEATRAEARRAGVSAEEIRLLDEDRRAAERDVEALQAIGLVYGGQPWVDLDAVARELGIPAELLEAAPPWEELLPDVTATAELVRERGTAWAEVWERMFRLAEHAGPRNAAELLPSELDVEGEE